MRIATQRNRKWFAISFLLLFFSYHTCLAESFLLKAKPGRRETLRKAYQRQGLKWVSSNYLAGYDVVETLPVRSRSQISRLLKNRNILWMVRNREVSLPQEQEVVAASLHWGLDQIHAEQAWRVLGHQGNRNVRVAVLDTGVDLSHPDLVKNLAQGFDFVDNDPDPSEELSATNPGHGTHGASVVGGTKAGPDGVLGVSPQVTLIPVRMLDSAGRARVDVAIRALDFAVEKKADIILASWGAYLSEAEAIPLVEAVKRARDHGVLVVTAAANDGKNNDIEGFYPANAGLDNVLVVTASDPKDLKPYWANSGHVRVHIAAPGVGIYGALAEGRHGHLSGTSSAAPFGAGVAALLKAGDVNLTPAQIVAILQTSGTAAEIEAACHCRLDAEGAATIVKNHSLYPVPATLFLSVQQDALLQIFNGHPPYVFESSDESVVKVDESGRLVGRGRGDAKILIRDSAGQTASVRQVSVDPFISIPPDCPLGYPWICDLVCYIVPYFAFCPERTP